MTTTDAPPHVRAPIGDYGLISDRQGCALAALDGSIDWACVQRFDFPSVFGRLLGESAGHWTIGPVGGAAHSERAYVADTMVLRTTFQTPSGRIAVTDAFALDADSRGHDIGRQVPHAILRVVEGIEGEVNVAVDLCPRPEYGLTVPLLIPCDGGLRTQGGPRAYFVSATVPLDTSGASATARFRVAAGDRHAFALQLASPWEPLPHAWTGDEIARALLGTINAWQSWTSLHQNYSGPYGTWCAPAAGCCGR